MKKEYIYYWAPFISYVATVRAVINSATSISRFGSDKNYVPVIIDAFGEWEKYYDEIRKENIEIIKLTKSNFFLRCNKLGFIKSRLAYLYIFFRCFIPLHKILKKNNPHSIIVHLITPLPFILFLIFNFKTKLVVRISGYPKFNFFRKLLWKLVQKRIFLITSPTQATVDLVRYNFNNNNNIKLLRDPIVYLKSILDIKKINEDYSNIINYKKYILAIGRLTKQKNFFFLIKVFKKVVELYKDVNLIIIGDGEEKDKILKYISYYNLQERVIIIPHSYNVYYYMQNSLCLVSTSLWEDPGFVLVEALFANTIVISSDCPNGPREVLDNGEAGYLFKINSEEDFLSIFNKFYSEKKETIFNKKIRGKLIARNYSLFSHYKVLEKILLI